MALRVRSRTEFAQTFRLIYPQDPAIDRGEFGKLVKYAGIPGRSEGGDWDPTPLKILDGTEPTWFVCRPLTARAVLVCDQQVSDELCRWWAFRYGIEQIVGLVGDERWVPEYEEADHGKFLKDKCVAELAQSVGMEVVYEIGRGILARAHLAVVEKKDSAQPPGSGKTP